jgi:glycosyltransferase involved in cell wall biosynthesis
LGIYLPETRVTVCIPHLMREEILIKCLQALKKNVILPYQVIIINDGKRPLYFKDERIQVINNPEKKGLGAARQRFAELVQTEFMFTLDNDILVLPRSLEAQVEALDQNPQMAAVSGVHFSGRRFCEVADFEIIDDKIIKRRYDLVEILATPGDLFEADFIPISHTTFRMKAIRDVTFDSFYKIGYDHWDTFLQFYFTDWKFAVHKKSLFLHLHHRSPKEYIKERHKETALNKSRKYFIEKWGYKPILPRKKRGEIFRKMPKRLASGYRYALAYIHAAILYTQAFIYRFLYTI